MCFDTTVTLKEMGYYVDYVIGTMPGYLLRMQNVFLFKSCRKCMLYCIFSLSLSTVLYLSLSIENHVHVYLTYITYIHVL